MGILDKMMDKAAVAARTHGGKFGKAVDKGADAVNRRTEGRHAGKIANVAGRAKSAVDDLGGRPPGATGPDAGRPGRGRPPAE